MDGLVDVLIPVDAAVAEALESVEQRQEIGRYISEVIRQRRLQRVMEAIAECKREARAAGLTDEDIDAELEVWRSERRR